MPIITCLFCEMTFPHYITSKEDAWKKARDHETKEHQRELQELEAQSHD